MSDPKPHIRADKSINYYKMETDEYNDLLEREIQKESRYKENKKGK